MAKLARGWLVSVPRYCDEVKADDIVLYSVTRICCSNVKNIAAIVTGVVIGL